MPAATSNRVLFRDGVPLAALAGGKVRGFGTFEGHELDGLETAIRRGKAPPALRAYL